MEDLLPWEHELMDGMVVRDGKVELDAVGLRIDNLIHRSLQQVATHPNGWNILYRDPADGRYWELDYPMPGTHGGGPRRLAALSVQEAESRYGI